ncbi:hypothetical protein GCM10010168_68610 [Actinoplanes ianthinogenes]|uniref:Uncharacterized protein n=1 Tax=Actinoplanes ianthinogenes TaxID=122358 RepID=A0ABM7M0E5_9ACTN|nr:hypothetical protein [Actinoplanes ianthinogenes]BCJ45061.1 hypothetical protein Aiant_57180 [Actinoplanes ianthinogenes]GGR40302.1 hypothetical protein GCM10010168_68610 [Actinoplanes ianthinogenes]
MDEVVVNREDIDALAEAVEQGDLPAPELLRALVTAIRESVGEDFRVSVSVEVDSVDDQFEASFAPEPSADRTVRVTVMKIGR